MAAMPTVSSSSPAASTLAVNRARRGLRYFSTVTPRNPTMLQEFYPEMVCAMTSSMITRVLLYPLDTVSSRVSAQGGSFPGIGVAPPMYTGYWDCWIRSIRSEGGIMGLYSGVIDCIIIEAMAKPPGASRTELDADYIKLPNMMKLSLDRQIKQGYSETTVIGILVQGWKVPVFCMCLEHEAIYEIKSIGHFDLIMDNMQLCKLINICPVLLEAK
ncbi:hypothetical protein BGZ99_000122, partial [Dissophora globulifera]